MDHFPFASLQKGAFAIASPEIDTGFFFRSVVLLCEHNTNGSFGLVVNKTLQLDLPEEIFQKSERQNPRVGVRAGGPVQTNQMMILHNSPHIEQQTLKIADQIYLGGDVHFLQESLSSAEGPSMQLCFGYAGWGAGQLEREFLDGHWFLQPATPVRLFDTPAEKLWQFLLQDMGGRYASLSMIPEDLSVN